MKKTLFTLLAAALFACGCTTGDRTSGSASDIYRVGSYNIRLASSGSKVKDGANYWDYRRAEMAKQLEDMDLDAFGLQEVTPVQYEYLSNALPGYAFTGDFRNADRKSGEASSVCYRRDRFEAEKTGTFWLSPTPDVPGSRGWGAACLRVCSYALLKDRRNGRRFCFVNTHPDHVSAEARVNGMKLILERMKDFAAGVPVVFAGDHNCRHADPPAVEIRKVLADARDISEKPDPGPNNTFNGFLSESDGPVDEKGRHFDIKDVRIDYLYVTPGTKVREFVTHGEMRGPGLFYSDHYPITAEIEFR